MPETRAILEYKKAPFLRAFVRTGKVAPATRAVRISRDAVYDWLRADATFRREFTAAQRDRYNAQTVALYGALDDFLTIAKTAIPASQIPTLTAAVNLALTNRRFNAASRSTSRAASRSVRSPSFDVYPEPANSVNGGGRDQTGKNGSDA